MYLKRPGLAKTESNPYALDTLPATGVRYTLALQYLRNVMKLPPELISQIRAGRSILFIGAGASVGAKNAKMSSPPVGEKLKNLIAAELNVKYSSGTGLRELFSFARRHLGENGLHDFMFQYYANCKPATFHFALMKKRMWKRIYSTNIDDVLENSYRSAVGSSPEIYVAESSIVAPLKRSSELQIIKLNGDIHGSFENFIFSEDQYQSYFHRNDNWYDECARDYRNETFIFIGSSLDEPLFWFHLNRLQAIEGSPKADIVKPKLDIIQSELMNEKNITFIPGSLSDFVNCIGSELADQEEYIDPVAVAFSSKRGIWSNPFELKKYPIEEINSMDLVDSVTLPAASVPTRGNRARDFYRDTNLLGRRWSTRYRPISQI